MGSTISSFVAFATKEADVTVLQAFANARGLNSDKIFNGGVSNATRYLKDNASPEVLLVELPSQEETPALLEELAEVCDPSTKVITIGSINEFTFYRWLMDIGIHEYLLCPLKHDMLEDVFAKLEDNEQGEDATKGSTPVIAVMGARGGVGTTCIAINLAGIIAEKGHKKVALIDCDIQEGSVSLALDIQPSIGVRDMFDAPDRIDSLFLERVMTKMGKYLSVLSAEESMGETIRMNPESVTPFLHEVRQKYDVVVLDIPRLLAPFNLKILQEVDHNILVCEPSLLSLRDTLRMRDSMRSHWDIKAPHIVVNKLGMAPKQEIPQADFEKGVGDKVAQYIPFEPNIFMPLSPNIPSVLHASHAAIAPIERLAEMLIPDMKSTPEIDKKKAISLTSLFKKKKV